jgi:hypothetical protein
LTEIVNLHVGSDLQRKHFRVHKALLCKKIPSLKKKLIGNKEWPEGVAIFPEDNPESFEILMKWVYSGALSTLAYPRDSEGVERGSVNILSLYVLLDKLCLHRLMDELVNRYIEHCLEGNFFLSRGNIDAIYTVTREGSPLRKWATYSLYFFLHGASPISDILTEHWPISAVHELMVRHPSVLRDYLELVRKLPPGEAPKDPRYVSKCTFHKHSEDKECPLQT